MEHDDKPKLVGLNHIVLEVGDLTAALDFYHAIFAFRLRGREDKMAFLDLGDQFLVLAEGRAQPEKLGVSPDKSADALAELDDKDMR